MFYPCKNTFFFKTKTWVKVKTATKNREVLVSYAECDKYTDYSNSFLCYYRKKRGGRFCNK